MAPERDSVGAPVEPAYRNVRRVATWLDDAFVIPGTRFRIGWDSLIGLIPGAGDLLTTLPALWIVMRALNLGVSNVVAARMILNILIDDVVGAIPILGDLFDIAWKANRRNVALLERYHREPKRTARRSRASLALAALALLITAGVLIVLPILVLVWLIRALGSGAG